MSTSPTFPRLGTIGDAEHDFGPCCRKCERTEVPQAGLPMGTVYLSSELGDLFLSRLGGSIGEKALRHVQSLTSGLLLPSIQDTLDALGLPRDNL